MTRVGAQRRKPAAPRRVTAGVALKQELREKERKLRVALRNARQDLRSLGVKRKPRAKPKRA